MALPQLPQLPSIPLSQPIQSNLDPDLQRLNERIQNQPAPTGNFLVNNFLTRALDRASKKLSTAIIQTAQTGRELATIVRNPNATKIEKAAKAIDFGLQSVGLGFVPFTAPLMVGSELEGKAAKPFKTVEKGFELAGRAGTTVLSTMAKPVVNVLPISDKDKQLLTKSIGDVGGLATQLAIPVLAHKYAPPMVRTGVSKYAPDVLFEKIKVDTIGLREYIATGKTGTLDPQLLDAFKGLTNAQKSNLVRGIYTEIPSAKPTAVARLLGFTEAELAAIRGGGLPNVPIKGNLPGIAPVPGQSRFAAGLSIKAFEEVGRTPVRVVPIPKSVDPLATEARKYKSAEELANSMGIKVKKYTGTQDIHGGITKEGDIYIKPGSSETTLRHELGHAIDKKIGLSEQIKANPSAFDVGGAEQQKLFANYPKQYTPKNEREIAAGIIDNYVKDPVAFDKNFPKISTQVKSQLTDMWERVNAKTTSSISPGKVPQPPSLTKLGIKSAPAPLVAQRETTLLKLKLTQQEKASKLGLRAGIEQGIERQKNIQANVVERVQRKGELKLLKEGIKIRARKDTIIQRLQDATETADAVKGEIVQYVKENLAPSEQGRFLNMVARAKTKKNLIKAYIRIDKVIEAVARKNIIADIKKAVDKLTESGKIDVDYRNRIKDLVSTIELQGHTKATMAKLESTKRFLLAEKAKGVDVSMPQRVLEKLQILARTPSKLLTLSQLEGLKYEIDLLQRFGETKQRAKEFLYAREKELITEDLFKTALPIDYKQTIQTPGEKLPTGEKIGNQYKIAFNRLKKMRLALRPIDGLAELTGMETMKNRFDVDYGNYLDHNTNFHIERQTLLDKLNLSKESMERIGIYATKVQQGGYEKLANLGISTEKADAVELTPSEKAYYDFGRKWFESDYPAVKDYMKEIYNQDVGKVENYVSFQTDFDAMSELEINERFGEFADVGVIRTKTTKKGFTEERTGAGKQKIKLNFDEILLRHKDDVAYMLNMGRDTKMYFEIINSDLMRTRLGDLGSFAWLEWLDLMARKGGTEGAKQIAILDSVRRNLGVAVMSFRLSSALIQLSSLSDAAGTIGGKWTGEGAWEVATSKEWRQFVLDNFPEIRQMVGDDPAYLEMKDTFLGKAGEVGLKPLKFLDGLMRSTTAIGAYKKLAKEKGIAIDLKNPDKEIIAEATKLVRQSQASSSFKDAPLAITKGMFIGNKSVDRLIFQFQSFMLNRWENIERQIWRKGFRKGDYKKGFAGIFWLILVAGLTEEFLRRGSRKLISLLTGEEKEEKDLEEALAKTAVGNVPIIGSIINSMTYDSHPVPVISAEEIIREGIKKVFTGVAPQTKAKGAVDVGTGILGLGFGVPGISQAGQIVKQAIGTAKPKKKTDIKGLPKLPALPKLPSLP